MSQALTTGAGCSSGPDVRHLRLHDGQHTAATLLPFEGVCPRVVMELVGRPQMCTTTDLYGHLRGADLWDAARGLVDILWTPETARPEAHDA